MSPFPPILAPLTIPLSKVYGAIINARNRRYDRGIGVQTIDRPVISVGNITTGGTGKTPMVMWIAEQLLGGGHKPVIAMRGYKSVNGVSDEQAMYAERLPNVPVVANPNRTDALREFLKVNPQFDCVILDDGFQHRQLKRDVDLVLIDATADTFNQRLLPAGHLREPLENLRRADAVVVTRARSLVDVLKSPNLLDQIEKLSWSDPQSVKDFNRNMKVVNTDTSVLKGNKAEIVADIERWHGRQPIALSRHTWINLHIFQNENSKAECPIDWLRGKRVLTMLGIGNPQSVIQHLEAAGANVAVNIPCSDHERYDTAHLATAKGLCTGCEAMVVTEKDWVKLRHLIDLSQWPVPIVVPNLNLQVFEGEEHLRDLIVSRVRASAGKPAG